MQLGLYSIDAVHKDVNPLHVAWAEGEMLR